LPGSGAAGAGDRVCLAQMVPGGGNAVRLLSIALVWFLLDRFTKYLVVTRMVEGESIPIIQDFLHITSTRNPGGAWSILAHQTWLFVLVSAVVSAAIIYMAFRPEGKRFWTALALGLVLAGALGNLWDRLDTGYVVDMIAFIFGTYHYPVFNVADIGINVGVGILVLGLLRAELQERRSKKGDAA
jgi:signal peptidase II